MIYFKKHQRNYQDRVSIVIAMCDEELIGKKLKNGNVVLDLEKYSNFYKGELVNNEKARELLSSFFNEQSAGVSFNLIGENVLQVAASFADVSKAKKFGKVPHLQIYKV